MNKQTSVDIEMEKLNLIATRPSEENVDSKSLSTYIAHIKYEEEHIKLGLNSCHSKQSLVNSELHKPSIIEASSLEANCNANTSLTIISHDNNRKEHLPSDETGPLADKCERILALKNASQPAHNEHTSRSKDEHDLMEAIRNNDVALAKKLIIYIADINKYKDTTGLSFLMCASKHGSTEISSELIEFGAYVEAIDIKGSTALIYASKKGFVEIAEMLIKHRANINARDHLGRTPLIYATHNGKIKMADMLIKYGADVNVKDKQCFTALIHAARNGEIKIADMLIKNGADINFRDKRRRSALKYASKNGKHEIAELLINAGAV